jgi:Mn-dependent DtxR family transcriptional regulator
MSTTADTLNRLHDHYVEAVNMAVAEGDDARVARLAEEFEVEATRVSASLSHVGLR